MYSSILEYCLLRPYAKLSQSRYFTILDFLKKHEFESRESLRARQWKKIQQLITYAYQEIPFYKTKWAVADIHHQDIQTLEDFSKLPILTKSQIQNNKSSLINPRFPKKKLIKNATGGSTGQPLQFFVTQEREIWNAATMALNYQWAGLRMVDKLAMLWGSPFDISRAHEIHEQIKNRILRRTLLPAFKLSDKELTCYNKILLRLQPCALLGYVSALTRFADFLETHGIKDHVIPSIITGAETLYPYQRNLLERVFHGKVFNRYGGRDSGAVAAECAEYHQLHINSEILYLETLPNGHLVVTDLYNYGMPFIRYDVEDIGSVSWEIPCECKRPTPLIKNLLGREHDLIIAQDGNVVPGEFFPHLFKDFSGIVQFQVIQDTTHALNLKIVKSDLFNAKDMENII